MANPAEPLPQLTFGEGLREAAIALSGEGAEQRTAQGLGRDFLEEHLIAGAQDAELAGGVRFGLAFGEFLIECGLDEALFDAMMEEDVIDGLQLPTEAIVCEVSDDGRDARKQLSLIGQQRGAGGGRGEGHSQL